MTQIEDEYAADDGADLTYAPPMEEADEPMEPPTPTYVTREDLDGFGASLLERLQANMNQAAPHPGLAPTNQATDDPWGGQLLDDYGEPDEYARGIADIAYARAREEILGGIRPVVHSMLSTNMVSGMDASIQQEAQAIIGERPDLVFQAQQDPFIADLIRQAAENRVRTASVPNSPPSGRTYNPSPNSGQAYSPEQAAVADSVFGDMPGYSGFSEYAKAARGGRR